MNVVVHYPETEESKKELSDKISEVHARAVIRFLKDNVKSKEEIEKIIKRICG